MTQRFFTSDLHIGHRLVAGLRGFWKFDQDNVKVPDTELHDYVLADMWDNTVGPKDEVYILGDLSINSGPQVIEWVENRPGKKYLVSGNHDKSHTAIFPRKAAAKIEEWSPYFEWILDESYEVIAGQTVPLPIVGVG